MASSSRRPLLTAEWRHLVMLNYEVLPATLAAHLPRGVEIDLWRGRALVSIVGFMFRNTRVRGIRVPCHVTFEEVNLRFYVLRRMPDGVRRGVVFIREIVPRWAIATLARRWYNEPYVALPMSHRIAPSPPHSDQPSGVRVEYGWRTGTNSNRAWIDVHGEPEPLVPGSEAEFITEHYWGYTPQKDGSTLEYEVTHPRWRVWTASDAGFECDVVPLYGAAFVECLAARPVSAFLAEGSPIAVHRGERMK